jgi:hypothetical protein
LIAACALHHGAGIETSDSDFDALNALSAVEYIKLRDPFRYSARNPFRIVSPIAALIGRMAAKRATRIATPKASATPIGLVRYSLHARVVPLAGGAAVLVIRARQ